jgi:MFS family permease
VAVGSVLSAVSIPFGGYLSDRLRRPLLVIGLSIAGLAMTTFLLVFVDYPPAFFLILAVN